MKTSCGCALAWIGLLASTCGAQPVYKCVVNGAATFQQEPCPAPAPKAAHAAALPADSPLLGTWRSDHALTMAWLRQHARLTPKQDALLDQLSGHMRFTFTRDHVKTDMPDIDVRIDGKPFPMKAFQTNAAYTVLSAGPKKVSISSADPAGGGASVSDFTFDDRDTMWQRMGGPQMPGLDPQAREYYRRVK